jgi:hypothetical protein
MRQEIVKTNTIVYKDLEEKKVALKILLNWSEDERRDGAIEIIINQPDEVSITATTTKIKEIDITQ